MVQVEGPAVSEFQELFSPIGIIKAARRSSLKTIFRRSDNKGDEIVRVLGSVPQEFSTNYVTLISAIRNAETNVYITDAYFAPDPQMLESLETVARRGVDVRLLLPGAHRPAADRAGRARSFFGAAGRGGQVLPLAGGRCCTRKPQLSTGSGPRLVPRISIGGVSRATMKSTRWFSAYALVGQMNESFMRDLKNSEQIEMLGCGSNDLL